MVTIHKYTIMNVNQHTLNIPKGGVVLKAAYEENKGVNLWIMVDTDREREERIFISKGTGQEINSDLKYHYIDTVFTQNGLVWHIFEVLDD